jgi:ubiquinone/menaquinone biosynthesis C-methylase UbiE
MGRILIDILTKRRPTMFPKIRCIRLILLLAASLIPLRAIGQEAASPPQQHESREKEDSQKRAAREKEEAQKRAARQQQDAERRAEALRALARRLDVGPASVIADIGAGNGRDTWVFAEIVGEGGKVYAEEIEEGKTKSLKEAAEKRGLAQVQAVLGDFGDPRLPADSADMAFMHQVYHHLSQPREMLQGIWRALKPGGHLVVVDRRLGTLADWAPVADRTRKHFWTAETTVVREAREQGFLFVEGAEDIWHEKEAFVLVFQRPRGLAAPDRDPDPPSKLSEAAVRRLLPAAGQPCSRVAFVALGEGRKLIAPILKATSAAAVDIVLEEWATQKDERPPLPSGVEMPSVLTASGDPNLGPDPIDAVYFLDTYHLLFHGPQLLAKLQERLVPTGRIYVLDRRAPRPVTRREASHRRMIAPAMVTEEMAKAGLDLLREEPLPAADRFLLVFGKAADK